MDENNAPKRVIYYIPDNFISEAKLHIGQISIDTKYLIDIIILGGIGALIGLIIVYSFMEGSSISNKIMVVVLFAAPGAIIGYIGFNGDPISKAFKSFLYWRKHSDVKIYNPNPRLMGTDAVKARNAEEKSRDKLVGIYHNFKEKQLEKKKEENLVEGENFHFAYDADVDDFLDDSGDFSSFQNSDGSYDINISGTDITETFYSKDGYNDEDEYEPEYYQSDFEHV